MFLSEMGSWVKFHQEPFGPDAPRKENHGAHSDSAPELSKVCYLPPNEHFVHLPTTGGVWGEHFTHMCKAGITYPFYRR